MTLPPEILEELAIERAEREARKAAAEALSDQRSRQADAFSVRLGQIEKGLAMAITWRSLAPFMLDAFKIFEEKRITPLLNEIKSLKARQAELEKYKQGIRYCGVWRSGAEYDLGDFVTYGGATRR